MTVHTEHGFDFEGKLTMIARAMTITAMLILLAGLPGPAASAESVSAARETVTPAFHEVIPGIPGKSLVGIVVRYAPGAATPGHRHATSAFVTGYVLSGAIRSQVDDGAPHVYQAGESWTEMPGAHHVVSENASLEEPATLLAIFVVDSSEAEALTRLDSQ